MSPLRHDDEAPEGESNARVSTLAWQRIWNQSGEQPDAMVMRGLKARATLAWQRI